MTAGGPFSSESEPGVDANVESAPMNGASTSMESSGSDEIDLRTTPSRSSVPLAASGATRPALFRGGRSAATRAEGDLGAHTATDPVVIGDEPEEHPVGYEGLSGTQMGHGAEVRPDEEADGAPVAEETSRIGDLTEGAVTREVVALLVPVLATLAIFAVVATGVFAYALTRASAARHVGDSLDHEQVVREDLDGLWVGLLEVVASGVGQDASTPAQVSKLVGEATANSPGPRPSGAGDENALALARRSHQNFVDKAEAALTADGADPLSVANELRSLAGAHGAAEEDLARYVDSLETSRRELESSAARWSVVALAIFAAGVIGSALQYPRLRRRANDLFDEPALATAAAVQRVADGDVGARSGTRTRAGLGTLAASVDAGLDGISAEIGSLQSRAAWGETSAMIFEALDDAQDEPSAYLVIERALGMIDEEHHPVELVISERGSGRVRPVANDTMAAGSVIVDTNVGCFAMRRGQVTVSSSSNSINACPMIRERADGPCSAVCVPISVGGRPIGVFHMIGPEFQPPGEKLVSRLVALSVQLGNRLAALRALESSRKEAATDGLTGLPNRRMLQSEVSALMAADTPFVMVLADLDKFKRLNDNFGHEIGDKALKLFADVLKKNVRGNDLVARIGGEEFVLVYPNMSVETSIEAIGRLRQALAAAVGGSTLPAFTCSFGVSDSTSGLDGESILRVADAGLLKAKELGGDQAVYADSELVDEIFGPGSERPQSDDPERR